MPKTNHFSWAVENFAVSSVVPCEKIFDWDHLVALAKKKKYTSTSQKVLHKKYYPDVHAMCVCVCPVFVSDCAKIDKSVTLNLKRPLGSQRFFH